MHTHNLCFEQKYEKYQNFYLETFFSFWWQNFQYILIGVLFFHCLRGTDTLSKETTVKTVLAPL